MGGLVALLTADRFAGGRRRPRPDRPSLCLRTPSSTSLDTVRFLGVPLLPFIGVAVPGTTATEALGAGERCSLHGVRARLIRPASRRRCWSRGGHGGGAATHAVVDPAFVEAGRSIARVVMRRQRFAKMVHRIGAPVTDDSRRQRTTSFRSTSPIGSDDRPDWELVVYQTSATSPQLEAARRVVRCDRDRQADSDCTLSLGGRLGRAHRTDRAARLWRGCDQPLSTTPRRPSMPAVKWPGTSQMIWYTPRSGAVKVMWSSSRLDDLARHQVDRSIVEIRIRLRSERRWRARPSCGRPTGRCSASTVISVAGGTTLSVGSNSKSDMSTVELGDELACTVLVAAARDRTNANEVR